MTINVEILGNRIYIDAPLSAKDDCQSIPGARWSKDARQWHLPISWGSCKALRAVFGTNLEIGPTLTAWAQNELAERITPALALRSTLDLPETAETVGLYPFQRAGAEFLCTARQALLADEMGSGKTIQTIAAARRLDALPALVICPASMRRTWGREINRWWPGAKVFVVEGTKSQRDKMFSHIFDIIGMCPTHSKESICQNQTQGKLQSVTRTGNTTPRTCVEAATRSNSGNQIQNSEKDSTQTTENGERTPSTEFPGKSTTLGLNELAGSVNSAQNPQLASIIVTKQEKSEVSCVTGATTPYTKPNGTLDGSTELKCTCNFFVVINWESVRLHSRLSGYGSIALSPAERTPGALNQIPFQLVVADEAHRMKDPKSKQTRAVWSCAHGPTVQYRWALTGTPLTAAPDTLWPVLHFMDANEWPSKTAFIERYCTPPDAPVYMADGSFKQIGEVQIGDEVIGFSKENGEGRCLESATVLAVNKRIAPEILKVTLESGKVIYCTSDHKWLSGKATQTNRGDRVFVKPAVGKKLVKVIDVPEELPTKLLQTAGWLGGIHDGEGTGYCIASQSITQNPDVCQRIDEAVASLSIGVRRQVCGDGSEIKWHARTRNDFVRFLNICKPVKRHEPSMKRAVFSCQWRDSDEIVSIESTGEGEVVSLTTSTQTYVVYGYASHNCLKAFNVWGGLDIFGIRPDREEEFFSIFDPRFRRMPKEVILPQLPEISYVTRGVRMAAKQEKAYNTMAERLWAETDDGDMVIASNPISQLTRLTQFASCTIEVNEEDEFKLCEPSSKLDAFMDDLDDLGTGLVVFSVSRQLLRLLAARFEKKKLSYSIIEGGQSPDIRQNALDSFQASKVDYILVVVAAGGVGLTLTRAATAVFLQVPWSNVDYQQAVGRIHRIGSEIHDAITVIHYLTENTVEERMLQVVHQKEGMLQEVVRDADAIKKFLKGKE